MADIVEASAEDIEDYEDHTTPHWAHVAFALGAVRGF
jgi:hypothetical protein